MRVKKSQIMIVGVVVIFIIGVLSGPRILSILNKDAQENLKPGDVIPGSLEVSFKKGVTVTEARKIITSLGLNLPFTPPEYFLFNLSPREKLSDEKIKQLTELLRHESIVYSVKGSPLIENYIFYVEFKENTSIAQARAMLTLFPELQLKEVSNNPIKIHWYGLGWWQRWLAQLRFKLDPSVEEAHHKIKEGPIEIF